MSFSPSLVFPSSEQGARGRSGVVLVPLISLEIALNMKWIHPSLLEQKPESGFHVFLVRKHCRA